LHCPPEGPVTALSPAGLDAAVIRNLAGKTWRILEQWQALADAAGPFAKPAAAVAWLKSAHGPSLSKAQIVVRTLSTAAVQHESRIDPTEALGGPVGAANRELFEALVTQVRKTRTECHARLGVRRRALGWTGRRLARERAQPGTVPVVVDVIEQFAPGPCATGFETAVHSRVFKGGETRSASGLSRQTVCPRRGCRRAPLPEGGITATSSPGIEFRDGIRQR